MNEFRVNRPTRLIRVEESFHAITCKNIINKSTNYLVVLPDASGKK